MLCNVLTAFFAVGFASMVSAQPEQPADAPAPKKLEIPGVNLSHGPTTVKLGKVAEVPLPEGFAFVGMDSIKTFYEITQNRLSGDEIGVVINPGNWMLFFSYEDSGHIDDNDKTDLDADAIYKAMEKGQAAGNAERKKRGWDEMRMKGWTSKPHYDENTHNLTWAFRLTSSADNYTGTWINQNIRLLGRTGYVSAILVGDDTADYAKTEAEANQFLSGFRFVPGQTYAEFKSGDKIAKYGLAALVLGGAGAVAAKTGFLSKFIKYIIVGVAAIGAWVVRMFKKLTGRQTETERFGD